MASGIKLGKFAPRPKRALAASSLSWVAWLVLGLLGWALCLALPNAAASCKLLAAKPGLLLGLSLGAIGFCVLWRTCLRRWTGWHALDTLEHELAHLLAAWSVGGRLSALEVGAGGGGSLRWIGARGHWWVALAPYWWPTPLLLAWAMVGKPLWQVSMPWHWQGILQAAGWGALLACHGIHTWRETSAQQSDLQSVGLVYATLFLTGAHALVLTLTLHYLAS